MKYNVFVSKKLCDPPILRAAYSDRMALMMAELSNLAYIPFENPSELPETVELIEKIRNAKDISKAKSELQNFLQKYEEEIKPKALEELQSYLSKANFDLVKTYNIAETQAFLAKQDEDIDGEKEPGIIVLSFRGTEKKFEDWKTDLKAKIVYVDGVGVHKGFWEAFSLVEEEIRNDLTPFLEKGYVLYIAGHSLGGALALFAACRLGNDSTGACYTFGAPRVACMGFDSKIKTPIYRVVNAHDFITRMPPQVPLQIARFILQIAVMIPGRRWMLEKLEDYLGYIHHGSLHYMKRGKNDFIGKFDDVEMMTNPAFFDMTLFWLMNCIFNFKGTIKDHSIQLYCDKLRAYAEKRN